HRPLRDRGGGLLLDRYNFADVLALEDDRVAASSAPFPGCVISRCDRRSNRCAGVSVVASQQEDGSPSLSGPNCILAWIYQPSLEACSARNRHWAASCSYTSQTSESRTVSART